jgi:hypothetical protein
MMFLKTTDNKLINVTYINVIEGGIFWASGSKNYEKYGYKVIAKTNDSKEYILMLSNIEEGLSREKAEINLDDYLINLITYL